MYYDTFKRHNLKTFMPLICRLRAVIESVKMSRALKKAVEAAKQRKEGGEVNVPDEGIANLEDVPELCKFMNKF